ncbi:MAG: hypothetical protein ACXVC6_05390 [Bacteroidia bacterium]
MKTRVILTSFLCFALYIGKAQMPGMGGSNGAFNSMNNLPQTSGSSGSSKKDEPPHGGEIKESGKYNIEVVFDPFAADEKMTVWVLKQNYKPAKVTGAKGTVKIKYVKLNKEEDRELVFSEDKFMCNVTEASEAFTAFITITIKGKEYRAIYNHKSM